ncbi:hypothetical protein AGMMS50212_12000 [Spirochaetia bacterium]|nr:hypothetical protein AGMMS50212_12000 [Spirochaetia bacterium]
MLKSRNKFFRIIFNAVLLITLAALSIGRRDIFPLKFYPLIVNGFLLCLFGFSLFFPPEIIFRFAVLQDKTIKGSPAEDQIRLYCRKVTIVWSGFFIFNAAVSAFTFLRCSDKVWVLYNCGISYILMGTLFLGEYLVRKVTQKKMPKTVFLSKFKVHSRPFETILCYGGVFADKKYKTWKDFILGTEKLRRVLTASDKQKWILHTQDSWYFLLGFTALLQCKKEICLTANVTRQYLEEMRDPYTTLLTDIELPDSVDIVSIIETESKTNSLPSGDFEEIPEIDGERTVINMYTSGTTGKPKIVKQRLTEFELDNSFIISRWGAEFIKRKFCSTVSHHHIWGLLFSVLLPFALGVPFRRTKIEFPEEFMPFTSDSYTIITVPAFLKRAAEADLHFEMKTPLIFTSGGEVPFETAKKTQDVFGFWPYEVYGSTETNGIGYRQSKDGPEWTPFDNAKVWIKEEEPNKGCLVIISPYIKDPSGFITGDIAEIFSDGRFLLKGRADSIVKIEEKRISLPEIESRIMQTGLVKDVCVRAMQDRRQYLAAAIALNADGKEKFACTEKYLINKFFYDFLIDFFEGTVIPKKWRFVDELPLDSQGKKKKEAIEALFAKK